MKRFLAFLLVVPFVFSSAAWAEDLYDVLISRYDGRTYAWDRTMSASSVSGAFAVQFSGIQAEDRNNLGVGNGTGIAFTNGFSLFFRGRDYSKDIWGALGIYVNNVEKEVLPKGCKLVQTNVGEASDYGMIVSPSLLRAKVYRDGSLLKEIELSDYGVTQLDLVNVLAGSNSSTATTGDFRLGQVYNTFSVGKSSPLSLIDTLDYSDTFTATGGRTTLGNVENSYGNAASTWTAGNIASGTGTVPDSLSGSTTGYASAVATFMDYNNLRSQFVVQVDSIQAKDRTGISVGTENNIAQGTDGFSVFIRSDGTTDPKGNNGAIGLYYGGSEYILFTGNAPFAAKSGITADTWNNYALRVDSLNMELEIFASGWSLGTYDLTNISALRWNDTGTTPSTAKMSTINAQKIGLTNYWDSSNNVFDNFQVGAPIMQGVTVGESSLFESAKTKSGLTDVQEYGETFRTTGTKTGDTYRCNLNNTWYSGANELSEFWLAFDATSQYAAGTYTCSETLQYVAGSGGTSAGSATGVAVLGNGVYYTMKLNDATNYLLVQSDAVQPDGTFDFVLAQDANNYFLVKFAENGISVQNEAEEVRNVDLSDSVDLININHWGNYALEFDAALQSLNIFLNEMEVASVQLGDDALSEIAYVGFRSDAISGISYGAVDNFQVLTGQVVPEPATWALFLLCAGGILAVSRRGLTRCPQSELNGVSTK
ncbi:MAG: hypothetical protein Q4D38_10760 [Planctomycetia bacterium]|nr:hypothetical protein [Planctomycetia bacterium]